VRFASKKSFSQYNPFVARDLQSAQLWLELHRVLGLGAPLGEWEDED